MGTLLEIAEVIKSPKYSNDPSMETSNVKMFEYIIDAVTIAQSENSKYLGYVPRYKKFYEGKTIDFFFKYLFVGKCLMHFNSFSSKLPSEVDENLS